jgi:hypothetical protein
VGKPFHRMTPDVAIELGNICPSNVSSQPEKDARSALIWATGQDDFLAHPESVCPR